MSVKRYFLPACLFISLASCRTPRFIYSPSPPNNPYFKEKGESKLAGYHSGGGNSNKAAGEYNRGVDLQAAYAITKHVALTASYFQRIEKEVLFPYNARHFDSSVIKYKRNITDVGGGYFTALGKSKIAYFNLFGGIGLGKFSFTDTGIDSIRQNYNRIFSNDIVKWYIQPSLNIFAGDNFRIGLISRYSNINYKKLQSTYTNDELNYFDLDRLKKANLGFFEHTLNAQFSISGAEWICIEGAFTFSSEPFDNKTNLEARNFNACIGLSFDFSKIKKK